MASMSYLKVLTSDEVDSQPPEVDIVAIHGLSPFSDEHHAENTWTSNGKLWLRDFLPRKLPRARVMLFSYNANVAFDPVNLGVRQHAEKLLELLHLEREDVAHRPIIFFCHSLGGLVIKRALVIAQTTKEYADLKNATYGIVFFGTPHRGGNLVPLGKFVSWVIRYVTPGKAKNNLLDNLEKNGFFAEELREDFRQQLESYRLISYFEEDNTRIGGKDFGKIVERESATFGLSIDREITLGLSGDHSSICKFSSVEETNYRLVEGRVVQMVKEAVKVRENAERMLALQPTGTTIQDISLHEQDLRST